MYHLCSLGHVSSIGCRGSSLFIGGCVSVSLITCENLRVHASARVCRVTNTFDTKIYLFTKNHRKIFGENREFFFAPYNVAYPAVNVRRHLEELDLDAVWKESHKIYGTAVTGSSNEAQSEELSAALALTLAAEQFLRFVVPVLGVVSGAIKYIAAGRDERKQTGDGNASLNVLLSVPVPLPAVMVDMDVLLSRMLKVINDLLEWATQ